LLKDAPTIGAIAEFLAAADDGIPASAGPVHAVA
jgi:hypothetical protein